MIKYYKENIQFYGLLIFWTIVGMYGGPIIYFVVPITLFMLKQKEMYEEIFIGYFFILIISDSLEERLGFAKSLKSIYLIIIALFLYFDRKKYPVFINVYKIFIPFFLFILITLFSSMADPFAAASIQKALAYFLLFIIVPTYSYNLFIEQGVLIFRKIILFGLTILLVGFLFRIMGLHLTTLTTGRYRGLMGNPNGLGIFSFLIFILFFIINDFYPTLFSKTERNIVYLASISSLFLSDSRNAILAILIFFAFQKFFSISPFLGFFFFIILLFTIEVISSNLSTIVVALGLGQYFRVDTLDNGSGRYVAWQFAWNQIQKSFFIGRGFAYNEYFMRKNYLYLSKLGHQGGVHNSFLSFWLDQGLVGLIIYLRSYIIMFIKASRITKFAFAIMFGISFTAFFESWLVGSLSGFAFLGMLIFTIISSEEFQSTKLSDSVDKNMDNKLLNEN